MKNAVYVATGIIVIILSVMILYSVNTRSVRQTDLDNTVSNSVEQSLNMSLESMTYRNLSSSATPEQIEELNKKMADNCRDCILKQIDTDSIVDIYIYEADFQTGILDVEVVQHFKYLNGKEGKVTCRRTGILKEY